MAKLKACSHYDRLHNPEHNVKVHPEKTEHLIPVTETVLDEETERPIKKISFQVRKRDSLKHYKVSDFCLENLQVSGAIDNLKSVNASLDTLSNISHLESKAKEITNI